MSNDEQKIYRLRNQANFFEKPHSQHFFRKPKIEIQKWKIRQLKSIYCIFNFEAKSITVSVEYWYTIYALNIIVKKNQEGDSKVLDIYLKFAL